MTKRSGYYGSNAHNKKPKLGDELEDLWGEDLDISAIDECFKLATQVCEQDNVRVTQVNDASILPSYNAFRDLNGMFTSTQDERSAPSTSKAANKMYSNIRSGYKRNYNEVEDKVQKLETALQAKEGEVTILRGKLQNIKSTMEAEHAKKQKEWSEKLSATVKDINAVKTELEFKNLEIMNLKQKVAEVSKFANGDVSFTQKLIKVETKQNIVKSGPSKLCKKLDEPKMLPNVQEKFPLKDLVPPTIFNVCSEEVFNSIKDCSLDGVNVATLNCVSPEIHLILNMDMKKLEEPETKHLLDKVLCAILQLLHNFHNFLKALEERLPENSIEKDIWKFEKGSLIIETDICVFDTRKTAENEVGYSVRPGVAFLAVLLPFNTYVRKYITENGSLEILKNRPDSYSRFSDLMLSCVRLIRKLKKSKECSGFLCAVTKLLTSLQYCEVKNCELIFEIFREIVLSKPSSRVVLEISSLLKYSSQNIDFVNMLCQEKVQGGRPSTDFQNACVFYILSLQISCINVNEDHSIVLYGNIVVFLYNVVNCKPTWLYYQDDISCSCLYQFTHLSVSAVYLCLKMRKKQNGLGISNKALFTTGVKLLHAVYCILYAMIEKSILKCTKYKKTIGLLLELSDNISIEPKEVELLEKLSLEDEMRPNTFKDFPEIL